LTRLAGRVQALGTAGGYRGFIVADGTCRVRERQP